MRLVRGRRRQSGRATKAMAQPPSHRDLARVITDAGAIATIIIEECGASMTQAIIAADRILAYLEGRA